MDLQWQFAMDILEKILSNLFLTEHNMLGVTRLCLFRHVGCVSYQHEFNEHNFLKTVGILQFYDGEEEEAIIVPPSARGVAPRRRWRGQQPRFVSRDSEDLNRRGVLSPAFL